MTLPSTVQSFVIVMIFVFTTGIMFPGFIPSWLITVSFLAKHSSNELKLFDWMWLQKS
jgi:hypothetical protein